MLLTLAIATPFTPALAGQIDIAEVEASSEYLRSADYPARHVQDGKTASSWVEGESGSGVGSWIELRFDKTYTVTELKIWAGDWSSRTAWERANRPAELVVWGGDGSTESWLLEDAWRAQSFHPESPRRADRVRLRIKSIHNGTAFPDTAIAELQAYGPDANDGTLPTRAVRASSTFGADADGSYLPTHVLDGIRDTFWCENDEAGDGSGQWLAFDLDGPHTLSSLAILNGMGSSADIHKTGNIATTATLEFSNGSTQEISLKPFFLPQKVALEPVETTSVKITFTGIRRGTDYNDLCISEVRFLP